MASITVSSRNSHSFCSFSPAATSSSTLEAMTAQKVALAFSHINAFRSWGAKHYTMKSCANAVGPLPQPKAANVPCNTLVLRPQLPGQSKYAFKPFSSPHKRNAFVRAVAAVPPASDGARQERAKAHAGFEKRSKGSSGPKSEPAPGIENVADPDKQVKTCNVCEYSKPLVDFEKTVTSADERAEACRACVAALKAWRPGSKMYQSWVLKLTPEEAWERAKICTKCRLVKELCDFGWDANLKDRILPHCRSCISRKNGARPARAPVDIPQQCSKCNEVKPASEYHLDRKSSTGLDRLCKRCKSERQSENRRNRFAILKESKQMIPRHKKLCTTCGQTQSVSEFYKTPMHIDGLGNQCRTCIHAYQKAYKKRRSQSKYTGDDGSPSK
jgi:hypothetical protein